jgi:cyanuric acid amidohydrolase
VALRHRAIRHARRKRGAVFVEFHSGHCSERRVLGHQLRCATDFLADQEARMTPGLMSVDVMCIPTKGPGDVSGLMTLIATGHISASDIVAVLGKTEGNGGVNDFTREYAVAALREALAPHLALEPRQVEEKIAFVMSGGTEGVLSPHLTVFARGASTDQKGNIDGTGPSGKRLSIGIAHSREFLPEEIGCKAQIDETVQAVHRAMHDAGINDPEDVHFVQVKCPLLTSERIEAAARRGSKTVTTSGYASMGYSRGASALGVAAGLGECDDVDERQVLKNWDSFSTVASCSAGSTFVRMQTNPTTTPSVSARNMQPLLSAQLLKTSVR